VLKEWETFYLMIGSAGAGLIGLLFVVVTLTAGLERAVTFRGARLFLSPTALDFAVVLSVSAVAIAPGLPIAAMASAFAFISLVGLGFAIRSSIGIYRPPPAGIDPPDWTDFWMYGVLPAVIYVALLATSGALGFELPGAPFVLAALLLALLLVGIRNAWDLITWIAPRRKDLVP